MAVSASSISCSVESADLPSAARWGLPTLSWRSANGAAERSRALRSVKTLRRTRRPTRNAMQTNHYWTARPQQQADISDKIGANRNLPSESSTRLQTCRHARLSLRTGLKRHCAGCRVQKQKKKVFCAAAARGVDKRSEGAKVW